MTPTDYTLVEVPRIVSITAMCKAFRAVKPAGYSFPGEVCNFYEAFFILHGSATVIAGDSVITLGEGQVIFYPPMAFRRIRNDSKTELELIDIAFSADRFPVTKPSAFFFPSPEEAGDLVVELRALYLANNASFTRLQSDSLGAAAQSLNNRLENYFLSLLSRGHILPPPNNDKNAVLFSSVAGTMGREMSKRLSATGLASQFSLSVSTLQKLFLHYTGMGMMQYYTLIRMRTARERLLEGATVSEAAASTGFDDPNYFSTAFKKHFGFPPTGIRERS